MRRWLFPLCLLALALAAAPADGQGKGRTFHIAFTPEVQPLDPFSPANRADLKPGDVAFTRGETFLLVLRGKAEPGWYTYPVTLAAEQNPDQKPTIEFKSEWLVPIGPIQESPWEVADDPAFGTYHKYKGEFSFAQRFFLDPKAPPDAKATVTALIDLQTCDPGKCVKEKHKVEATVKVAAAEPFSLTPEQETALAAFDKVRLKPEQPGNPPTPPNPNTKPLPVLTGDFDWRSFTVVESPEAIGVTAAGSSGIWGTILAGLLGGLIALATPCVFPMIPVTVSIFLKRGEKTGGGSPFLMALIYCGTIVAVLTAGGVALVSVLQPISQHWATNVFLGALFVYFALSLLGMYEIELPSWLSNLTSTRENQSSVLGLMFMALTFSVISFACVGPIYGGFISLSASDADGGWLKRILGPLAFSMAFAAPFFLLALFPTLLKSMPKSGSWMNTIKVVMGFLELAAAVKFFRAAELNFLSTARYFTFDLAIGVYIALALACGVYLLGLYRLPHDSKSETIGVPRLMFSLAFLSIAFYLLPNTFKDTQDRSQKPRGVLSEWTRAFLLPDDPSEWRSDLAIALAEADRDGKAVFLDFTGMG